MKKHRIAGVISNSIADDLEIKKGDLLLSLNGKEINDFLDYRMEICNDIIELEIASGNETVTYEIEKNMYEDIGLVFGSALMDKPRKCQNKCIFCFIDQLPEDMRKTMYFKDDDIRLSFLYGNYVTLTNIDDRELDRIIKHRLSPLNISVHSADPVLRAKIMGNKKAGDIMERIKKLLTERIELNLQFVILTGVNDGSALTDSLDSIYDTGMPVNSISVVPVGLTQFRKSNERYSINSSAASELIHNVDKYREKYKNRYGKYTIYAADELYIKAGVDIPDGSYYEDYAQLENGVGMVRSFCNDFERSCAEFSSDGLTGRYSIVTGAAFYDYIVKMIRLIDNDNRVKVHKIINRFFGGSVDVTGLLTFEDITEQLADEDINETVIIPGIIFKKDEDLTLDGHSAKEFEKKLKRNIIIVPENAEALLKVLYSNNR
jgi:putative radical SAM enzyme (TIGR03279 family)